MQGPIRVFSYVSCVGRTLPAVQFDSIVAAGTAEAALARESEARAQSEAASLRREAITAWKQVEERQQALQALEVSVIAYDAFWRTATRTSN